VSEKKQNESKPIAIPFLENVSFQTHKKNIYIEDCLKDIIIIRGKFFSEFIFEIAIKSPYTPLNILIKTNTIMYCTIAKKPKFIEKNRDIQLNINYIYTKNPQVRFGSLLSKPFIKIVNYG
jgi:hypothetical protein